MVNVKRTSKTTTTTTTPVNHKYTTTTKKTGKAGKYSFEEICEMIRKRAYYIYCERKHKPGDPVNDWLRAEREVKEDLGIA